MADQLLEFIRDMIAKNKPDAVILERLKRQKGITISQSTLTRYKKKHNIRRHDPTVSSAAVTAAIIKERASTGLNAGIRFLQLALRQRHGLMVTRRQVQNIRTIMNAQHQAPFFRGLPLERRLLFCPGPNFRWCVDGYDKLQRFGIYIHGCVDEYSRRLLWLRAYSTNRRPEIVVKYYLEAAMALAVAPDCVVSDFGNECNIIAECQQFFYRCDANPARHHRWTYSILNVTIEAFWRRFRAMSGQYWINKCEELMYDGDWDGGVIDMQCLYAVYLPLIDADLRRVMDEHNSHSIRAQRDRLRPSGVPEDIYDLPDRYGGRGCGLAVTESDVSDVLRYLRIGSLELPDLLPVDVRLLIDNWLARNRLHVTVDNARAVYRQLRELLFYRFTNA